MSVYLHLPGRTCYVRSNSLCVMLTFTARVQRSMLSLFPSANRVNLSTIPLFVLSGLLFSLFWTKYSVVSNLLRISIFNHNEIVVEWLPTKLHNDQSVFSCVALLTDWQTIRHVDTHFFLTLKFTLTVMVTVTMVMLHGTSYKQSAIA